MGGKYSGNIRFGHQPYVGDKMCCSYFTSCLTVCSFSVNYTRFIRCIASVSGRAQIIVSTYTINNLLRNVLHLCFKNIIDFFLGSVHKKGN